MKFGKRFLRLFPAHRELEKDLRDMDDVLNNAAAAIEAGKSEIGRLKKKIASDSSLIKSLNRYIEALEGKAAAQNELKQELREKLTALNTALDTLRSQMEPPRQ